MNASQLSRIGTHVRRLSPYFLVELLLPGGSLLALLLWLHQRHHKGHAS
jgi:hypothetical protein